MKITFRGTEFAIERYDRVQFVVKQFNADKVEIDAILSPFHRFEDALSYTIDIPYLQDAKYYQVGIWDLELAAPVSVSKDDMLIHTFQGGINNQWQYTPLIQHKMSKEEIRKLEREVIKMHKEGLHSVTIAARTGFRAVDVREIIEDEKKEKGDK